MPAEREWDAIARVLVDAYDVDLQNYQTRLVRDLKNTPSGARFVDWAERNRSTFEILLRVVSVAVQRLPRDRGVILDTVRDQLARLPADVRDAVLTDSSTDSGGPARGLLSDREFSQQYEAALEGLSDQDLAFVASLPRERLKEWVLSPARIRPHKLALWRSEVPFGTQVDHLLQRWHDSQVRRGLNPPPLTRDKPQ